MKLLLGRNKPVYGFYDAQLNLRDYLKDGIPAPPGALTRTNLVTKPWQMSGNAAAGDCTIASRAHQILFWSSIAGNPRIPSDKLCLEQYYKMTGGPDSGLVIQDVLKSWFTGAIGTDRILAYAKVNPQDLNEVRQAIDLFGSVTLGVELPTFITAALDQGKVLNWDVPAGGMTLDPDGGHCIPIMDYDADSFTCVTWGQLMKMSVAFYKQVVDESWAVLSSDWLSAKGQQIFGVDLAGMTSDWKAYVGT